MTIMTDGKGAFDPDALKQAAFEAMTHLSYIQPGARKGYKTAEEFIAGYCDYIKDKMAWEIHKKYPGTVQKMTAEEMFQRWFDVPSYKLYDYEEWAGHHYYYITKDPGMEFEYSGLIDAYHLIPEAERLKVREEIIKVFQDCGKSVVQDLADWHNKQAEDYNNVHYVLQKYGTEESIGTFQTLEEAEKGAEEISIDVDLYSVRNDNGDWKYHKSIFVTDKEGESEND